MIKQNKIQYKEKIKINFQTKNKTKKMTEKESMAFDKHDPVHSNIFHQFHSPVVCVCVSISERTS